MRKRVPQPGTSAGPRFFFPRSRRDHASYETRRDKTGQPRPRELRDGAGLCWPTRIPDDLISPPIEKSTATEPSCRHLPPGRQPCNHCVGKVGKVGKVGTVGKVCRHGGRHRGMFSVRARTPYLCSVHRLISPAEHELGKRYECEAKWMDAQSPDRWGRHAVHSTNNRSRALAQRPCMVTV